MKKVDNYYWCDHLDGFVTVGCDRNTSNREISSQKIHMTICYDDGTVKVYRNDETGVYYIGGSSYRSGWCVMVNADGTPYTGESHEK